MRSDLNNQSDQNHTGAHAHVKFSFRDEGRRRRRRDGRERGDVEKLERGGEVCRGQYAKFELQATFERWKLGVTFSEGNDLSHSSFIIFICCFSSFSAS